LFFVDGKENPEAQAPSPAITTQPEERPGLPSAFSFQSIINATTFCIAVSSCDETFD
jgi:hypothetical protein